MNRYARALAQWPLLALALVGGIATVCLVIPLVTRKFPDFSDPTLGFEARGSDLSQRLTAWENLIKSTQPSGSLTVNPNAHINPDYNAPKVPKPKKKPKNNKNKHQNKNKTVVSFDLSNVTITNDGPVDVNGTMEHTHYGYGKNFSYVAEEHLDNVNYWRNQWKTLRELDTPRKKQEHQEPTHNGFFCGSPTPDYGHMVFMSVPSAQLFSLSTMLSMCELEHQILESRIYPDLCEAQHYNGAIKCCRPWALHNYITVLGGKSNCRDITELDVNNTLSLLQDCARYYHSLQLSAECADPGSGFCQGVPTRCVQHNTVYNVLHFLTDDEFLPSDNLSATVLQYAMIFLPIAASSSSLPFFHALPADLSHNTVRIAAMDLGIKSLLFDEYLLADTWLISLGIACVFLCMWIYTGSVFLTLMTLVAIVFSIGFSFFCYEMLFNLKFFPFMNLLATVVAVGIGADGAFILIKVWQCERCTTRPFGRSVAPSVEVPPITNASTLTPVLRHTLEHASVSMLVTSLTTAAAFYASVFSSITAVRCFGIFAGTAVLANYILMVTWLPAAIAALERFGSCCETTLWFYGPVHGIIDILHGYGHAIERAMIEGVIRFRWVWLILLGLLAAVSCVVVLYYPQLRLPDSPEFQLFSSDHPFELYDLHYRNKFRFERLAKVGLDSKLQLQFVWGVLPVDTGDYMDPSSRGSLILDPEFNVSRPESQQWLLQFCRGLRKQEFYQSTLGPLLPNCFIENFITWMRRRCIDTIDNLDRSPCCESHSFPFSSDVFNTCILQAISDLYETPREYFIPGLAGPRFTKPVDNNISASRIQALVVEFDSNVSYSMSFSVMNDFYTKVDNWTKNEMSTAPEGMRKGWFVSHLEFYNLQDTLSKGTLIAIAVSMGIALVVLLMATLNVLISLYAIITVTCAIFVTVAILVLLGWKLNVLESIAVSTAIGLAVDFSLHYGVHYRLAPENAQDRDSRTRYALTRMIGPTAMAALTTLAAGAFMLPSQVLAYIQIGLFLVIVMTVSWIYSTFFLGSLLHIAGPHKGFGQYTYPNFKTNKREAQSRNGIDHAQIGVVSERSLSGCSTVLTMNHSESHELEALTGKSQCRKPPPNHVHFKHSKPATVCPSNDQSPSAMSAITVILAEDFEELRPRM